MKKKEKMTPDEKRERKNLEHFWNKSVPNMPGVRLATQERPILNNVIGDVKLIMDLWSPMPFCKLGI